MSSRLNEDSVIAKWDTGLALPLMANVDRQVNLDSSVDLKSLISLDEPKEKIQAIDRRELYIALKSADPEVALEVLPHLSSEQFVALIDSDGWHNDRLALQGVINWLDLYRQHGLDQMFNRFRELDEEYQTALLSNYITIADEAEYEVMSHEEQDRFVALPCNTLWYRVHSDDPRVQSFVDNLIQGGLGEDVQYTYSLLSHVAYLPPNEQEQLIAQFRRARLEEDGFALPEESASLFLPFNNLLLAEKWAARLEQDGKSNAIRPVIRQTSFMDEVLKNIKTSSTADSEAIENVQRSLLSVANAAACACQVQPDDFSEMKKLLVHVRSLVGLGLESLSRGDILLASEILFTEGAKILFMYALSLIDVYRDEAIDNLKIHGGVGGDKLELSYKMRRYGRVLWNIEHYLGDFLGFESTEMLKGLFNRLPVIIDQDLLAQEPDRAVFKPIGSLSDLESLNKFVESLNFSGRHQLDPVTDSAEILN